MPNNTTKALENALNPTPATNPNTLPKLTWRIFDAVRIPLSPLPQTFRPVLPCLTSTGSSGEIPQPGMVLSPVRG